ncbi:hypothetical protein C8J57DRAFT_1249779 [Mycena rebaudengoi]|nr:hypothetical protein C8J57DRAFT_1249779 [Mycena rebaudengoi]
MFSFNHTFAVQLRGKSASVTLQCRGSTSPTYNSGKTYTFLDRGKRVSSKQFTEETDDFGTLWFSKDSRPSEVKPYMMTTKFAGVFQECEGDNGPRLGIGRQPRNSSLVGKKISHVLMGFWNDVDKAFVPMATTQPTWLKESDGEPALNISIRFDERGWDAVRIFGHHPTHEEHSKMVKDEVIRLSLIRLITLWKKGDLEDVATRMASKEMRDGRLRQIKESLIAMLVRQTLTVTAPFGCYRTKMISFGFGTQSARFGADLPGSVRIRVDQQGSARIGTELGMVLVLRIRTS